MKYFKTTLYPIKVQFEDVDAGGGVHNPNYLKYFERARNSTLTEGGYPQSELLKDGFALVVSECFIKYARPAMMDQDLYVLTRISGASKLALKIEQVLVSKKPDGDLETLGDDLTKAEGLLTICKTKMVSADLKRMRPAKFPEKVATIFGLPESPEAGRDSVELF